MLQELRFQLSTALLTVITIAAAIAAGVNYEQNHKFRLPDDGVLWSDSARGVVAARVTPDGPADRAGIHEGDILRSIQSITIGHADDVPRTLGAIGAWGKAVYDLGRKAMDGQSLVYTSSNRLHRRGGARSASFVSISGRYGVSGDRAVYLLPARQRARRPAFLRLLSRLVRFFLLPLHGQAEFVRSGDVLGQPGGGLAGAGCFPAFLSGFSRTASLATPLDDRGDLRSGCNF